MSLIDEKWELLFDRYEIEKKVSESGLFYITADQIREYKEPRLMTKFDTRESLPKVFGKKLGILPVTRGSYVIGDFDLYQDFPEQEMLSENAADSCKDRIDQVSNRVKRVYLPDGYETIDINDIRSEAGAINVMGITGILDDFLGGSNFRQTVSGRMASGHFTCFVNPHGLKKEAGPAAFLPSGAHVPSRLEIQNSQVEIDGGFENRESFAVLEGKNVVHGNFLVRQLYYPYRLWEQKLKKPVRPVFMVYSNNIFRLMEYEFTDLLHYNSIRLVQERLYSLEDTEITWEALRAVWQQTQVKPEPDVTFIQADSFEKVISLAEHLNDHAMTAAEIAEVFAFQERQSDYYFNACRFLGLAEKRKDEDGYIRVHLTKQGKGVQKLRYKARQLEYVRLILEHEIFHELFGIVLQNGMIPDKREICRRMEELRLCSPSLILRRSSSVVGWLRWMAGLTE